jgi:hypothetical protein
LPALAFGSHYSVFKERPGTHLSCRCWCRVAQRTVPDELLRRRVSFGCRRARGGRSDGCVTLADTRRTVNAFARAEIRRASAPGRPQGPIVAGHPPAAADARSNGPVPWISPRSNAPDGGMRRALRPSACHPALEVNWLSAPPFRQSQAAGRRAPPAVLLDLPLVTDPHACHKMR